MRRSLSATLGGFILGLLLASGFLLAGSYTVQQELGASFLLGGSLLCAASASLLLSFRLYLRGIGVAVEPMVFAESRMTAGLRARFARMPAVELRLRRHSGHRLDGELLVHGVSYGSETLVRVAIDRPPGSRIAIAAADVRAVPVSVTGALPEQRLERVIAPGAAEQIGVYLLLDDAGIRAPKVALTLEFAVPGDGATRRRCTVQAPIPG